MEVKSKVTQDEFDQTIEDLKAVEDKLNIWELTFIDDISNKDSNTLTYGQKVKLKEICTKVGIDT
jgi:hypothetical protein